MPSLPVHRVRQPRWRLRYHLPRPTGLHHAGRDLEEISPLADEARRLWLETAYAQGEPPIPLPSYPDEHSGKLHLRLPKSLHRQLAEGAERDGVSLNSHIVALLSRRDGEAQTADRLDRLEAALAARHPDAPPAPDQTRATTTLKPRPPRRRG